MIRFLAELTTSGLYNNYVYRAEIWASFACVPLPCGRSYDDDDDLHHDDDDDDDDCFK